LSPKGEILDPDQWTEEIAGAVRDFETRTITRTTESYTEVEVIRKLKLHDKGAGD